MKQVVIAIAIWFGLAGAARADDKTKQAASHYKQGKVFFDAKAYDQAISEYQAAYALDQRPAHLYNIGRAYHLKGDPKGALEYYQKFLAAEPDGATAAQVREYVAVATAEVNAAETKRKAAEDAARAAAEAKLRAEQLETKRVAATSHEKQAEAYAKAGAWASAGDEYKLATEADGDPAHLLAAAAAFEKHPDNEKARAAYLAYLEKVPLGPQSDAIRTKVAETTRAIEQAEAEARQAKLREELAKRPQDAPPVPKAPARVTSHRGWIVVGGALLLTGLAADLLPTNSKNGQLDPSDFAPPALYTLAAAAVLRGVF